MNFKIENTSLKVVISSKGAELQSIFNKENQTEYLWQGDSKYWGRKAPILFPIVGQVQHGEYEYQNKKYKLSQHGFLRDKELQLKHQDNHSIILSLKSNDDTKLVYPFDFEVLINYWIEGKNLFSSYTFINLDENKPMYFSFGLHPGFNVPIQEGLTFEDYYLEFEKTETSPCLLLDGPFLSGKTDDAILNQTNKINLKHSLFDNDALIFEDLKSNWIYLKSDKSNFSVGMQIAGFPLLGIWTKPHSDAPYICIEPWYGVADEKDSGKTYIQKKGIQCLSPNEDIKIETCIKID